MASVLSAPQFHDEAAAYAFVEARVWPNGPFCPHCGEAERIYRIAPNPAKKVRLGLCKCGSCRKQFTVKVGTVFESSHVPLHVWLQAMHLLCSSKKGISSNQLHRTLGVTLKTAWFMSHRIREAMRDGSLTPLGGSGKIVEADETYIGRIRGMRKSRGPSHKMKVLSLVERGGSVRSIVRVDDFFESQIARTLTLDRGSSTRFSGESFVAFDGEIKAVDIRTAVPRLSLILTAGRREIDCVYPNASSDLLGSHLDKRVIVQGFGFFDGKGGLPARIRIHSIKLVPTGRDVSRWRGSFEPFELEEWEVAK